MCGSLIIFLISAYPFETVGKYIMWCTRRREKAKGTLFYSLFIHLAHSLPICPLVAIKTHYSVYKWWMYIIYIQRWQIPFTEVLRHLYFTWMIPFYATSYLYSIIRYHSEMLLMHCWISINHLIMWYIIILQVCGTFCCRTNSFTLIS